MKNQLRDLQQTLVLQLVRLQKYSEKDEGFVIVSMILMLLILTSLLTAYTLLLKFETSSTKASASSNTGFYTAEAGLNLRAKQVQDKFIGYNRPQGNAPDSWENCLSNTGNTGSNDFACSKQTFNNQTLLTYVEEDPDNPNSILINPSEPFAGLNAQEYRYDVTSVAVNSQKLPTAALGMRFKSRLVPMFQFAVFYNKDLEISPGPNMTLSGRVHSNGDLYLNSGNTLAIGGQVTTRDNLYRGRKDNNNCDGTVNVDDDTDTARSLNCSSGRTLFTQSNVTAWNEEIIVGVPEVTVPPPQDFDPAPGNLYWDKADLRIVLELDSSGNPNGIEVRNQDNTVNVAATNALLNSCAPANVSTSDTFKNYREKRGVSGSNAGTNIRMLEVDVQGLLNCAHTQNLMGKALDDDTEGGLVWFLTVIGPDSSGINNYGVRLRNGVELAGAGAPAIKGLTVVSDQAIYVKGDYNATNKKPAAILADTINVLSNNWKMDDSASTVQLNNSARDAAETTINAAFLAATDSTGGAEGAAGQGGDYNGGLENYPRFHEDWSGVNLNYLGSFVSLGKPRHVNGPWCGTGNGCNIYNAPGRNWGYDTDFNDAANLPPLTPRVVYLVQEVFSRDFER